jgi:hypothetical protein
MLLHLPRSLNLTFDDMFRDDVSMDSFNETIAGQTDKPGLDARDGKTDAFLIDGSRLWKFILTTILIQEIVLQPVQIRKKMYNSKN